MLGAAAECLGCDRPGLKQMCEFPRPHLPTDPFAPPRFPRQMHVTYSKHRNLVIRPGERSRDYTAAAPGAPAGAPAGGPAAGAAPAAQPQAASPYGAYPAGPPAGAAPAAYPQAAHAAPPAHAMGGPPAGMHPAAGGAPPQRPFGAPPAAAPQQQAYAAPPPTRQHYDPNVVVTGMWAAREHVGQSAVTSPGHMVCLHERPPKCAAAAHHAARSVSCAHTAAGEDFVRQHERVLQQAGGRTAGPPGAPSYGAPAVSVLL